ncbi:MAG: SGNH/GDSL hydrolase family protein [Kofleriaceae bacterium]
MGYVRYWSQVAGWLLAMFAVFEVLCRLAISNTPEMVSDKRFGPITAPNHVQLQSNEGWAKNRTNELGNIDAPMPAVLPEDGILVVGDSLTQGDQVPMSERYTDRAGVLLGRRIYNAGHGSWSLVNHVAFLEAELSRYKPRTIIVQVSGNDLGEMWSRGQAHLQEKGTDFTIAVPYAKNSKLHELIMTRSAFVRRFVQRLRATFFGKADANDTAKRAQVVDSRTPRGLAYLMLRMKSHGILPIVLYFPTLDYHRGCIDTWAEAGRLFDDAARDAGFVFVDVTRDLCQSFAKTRQPLNGFWNTVPGEGHLNSAGHAVIAQSVADAVRRQEAQARP